MRSRNSSNRLASSSSSSAFGSQVSTLFLAMFATSATIYVASRLWQDAENRLHLLQQLQQHSSQGNSAISVDDTLRLITCRENNKRLMAVEADLALAKQEGFVSKRITKSENENENVKSEGSNKKKIIAVVGVMTTFGRRKNRDAIRRAWMPTGDGLKKLEDQKGIVLRFVIGRSANRGDHLDWEIDGENRQTNDFFFLNDQAESMEEKSKKTKLYFVHAAETWEADFYAKVNDDVFIKIDALGATLSAHLDKHRVYIGCMKSGQVFSEPTQKWYEPEWWKFGDGKSYFRHASGEIYAISKALAQFISINRSMLRTYAHDDVSTGSWFIGLDVEHVNESKFCCSSWSSGAICAAA